MSDEILNKILAKVVDMDEQLKNLPTKDDLVNAKSEIMNHVDGFVALHHKLDIEFTALSAKYTRPEEQLQAIMKHINYQPN